MEACWLCGASLDQTGATCPCCGIAAARSPFFGGRWRRAARAARVTVALSGLVLLGFAAAAAWRGWRSSARCEPHSWADWHAAIQRACLTPEYVCRNMTTERLLADPEILADYHRALRTGEREALAYLEALVAHLRAAYGCERSGTEATPSLDPRAPAGPLPLPGVLPIFEPPPTLTI